MSLKAQKLIIISYNYSATAVYLGYIKYLVCKKELWHKLNSVHFIVHVFINSIQTIIQVLQFYSTQYDPEMLAGL